VSVSINTRAGPIGHDGGMNEQSRHVSEHIERPVDAVYDYIADPANMAEWAAGLGSSLKQVDGQWFIEQPEGQASLAFAPRNDLGVLDHWVTLGSGEVVYAPMRVIADEAGSEVIFTVRRRAGMTDAEFDADAGAVAADLVHLRQLLEG
jgi:hypothetical protein